MSVTQFGKGKLDRRDQRVLFLADKPEMGQKTAGMSGPVMEGRSNLG